MVESDAVVDELLSGACGLGAEATGRCTAVKLCAKDASVEVDVVGDALGFFRRAQARAGDEVHDPEDDGLCARVWVWMIVSVGRIGRGTGKGIREGGRGRTVMTNE